MAEHLDGWVSRSVLIEESGLDGDVVDKALHALELNDVILQDETKLDHYRVPTKSFAVWLRARNKVHLVAGNEANVARLFDR